MKNILLIVLVFFIASCANNEQRTLEGRKLGLCQAVNGEQNNNEAIPCKIKQPRYPRNAAVKGVQGDVTFSFSISEKGKPTDIKIVESEPAGVFDKSAMEVISHWVFMSKTVNGSRVKQEDMIYVMQFRVR